MANHRTRLSKSDRRLAASWARYFLPMPDDQHVMLKLTVGSVEMSTAIDTDAYGNVTVEIPEAILSAMGAWLSGERVVVISRSFDLGTVARHSSNGYPIPYKTIRAWLFNEDETVKAIAADEIRRAYSFDAETGEPLDLDPSEIFADAWELAADIESV